MFHVSRGALNAMSVNCVYDISWRAAHYSNQAGSASFVSIHQLVSDMCSERVEIKMISYVRLKLKHIE